jgi:integrase
MSKIDTSHTKLTARWECFPRFSIWLSSGASVPTVLTQPVILKSIKRRRADELARLGKALLEAEQNVTEPTPAIAAFRLLLVTGCRRNEIQTLKWEYIQGTSLVLPDSKTGAKKVALGNVALEILMAMPRVSNNPYVIPGKRPLTHLTDLERPWRRIRKRAGLADVRIHDLRHSFASNAIGLGESLPMIGKLLGHTQVQTTARYAHLANDPVQLAADRVSSDMARALGMS